MKAYFRNTNDTLILSKDTNKRAENIIYNLNVFNKNIRFTLQTQINNEINFMILVLYKTNSISMFIDNLYNIK